MLLYSIILAGGQASAKLFRLLKPGVEFRMNLSQHRRYCERTGFAFVPPTAEEPRGHGLPSIIMAQQPQNQGKSPSVGGMYPLLDGTAVVKRQPSAQKDQLVGIIKVSRIFRRSVIFWLRN